MATHHRSKDEQRFKDALRPVDREKIVKTYLPDPIPVASSKQQRRNKKPFRKTPIRSFLRNQLHQLAYNLTHIVFGICLRLIQTYRAVVERIFAIVYYHHRTPELIQKDVKGLKRIPEHLAVILSLRKEDDALAVLMDEVAELSAWCTCSGIQALSIYEKTGILKSCIPVLHQVITSKFSSYYGSPSHQPKLHLFAPHHPIYDDQRNNKYSPTDSETINPSSLTLLLLSATDGQETFVDLTKTLAEMSQNGKLSPEDITPELIDAEISEITAQPSKSDPNTTTTNGEKLEGDTTDNHSINSLPFIKPEPDLLLVFGSNLILDGFPPWHIRLTEMYCTGGRSDGITGYGEAVEYQGFLRGLWHFAGAHMRFGQ